MLRRTILLIIAVLTLNNVWGRVWSATEVPDPHTSHTQSGGREWVANPDGILSPEAVSRLENMLTTINSKSGAQFAVAVVDDIDTDIDDFASALFNTWGIGRKGADNGVLFVVATGPRSYAIRTGRGIDHILPDVTTSRIARNDIVPLFANGDIEGGVFSGVEAIGSVLTDEENVAQIKADADSARKSESETFWDIIITYLWLSVGLTIGLFIAFVWKINKTKGLERHTRYQELYPMKRILFGLSFVGLGIPLVVYLPARAYLHNLRDGKHPCPNCGTTMHKIDEVHDNEHLTPAQDAEERLNSVDYDVWLCPNCGEEDIYAFENRDSALTECPYCHARTAKYLRDRVVKAPDTKHEGMAVKEYDCLNCKKISRVPYILPKVVSAAAGAAATLPFIFMGGRGGGGGGFGGGFGGGSTGGGGTSGSW